MHRRFTTAGFLLQNNASHPLAGAPRPHAKRTRLGFSPPDAAHRSRPQRKRPSPAQGHARHPKPAPHLRVHPHRQAPQKIPTRRVSFFKPIRRAEVPLILVPLNFSHGKDACPLFRFAGRGDLRELFQVGISHEPTAAIRRLPQKRVIRNACPFFFLSLLSYAGAESLDRFKPRRKVEKDSLSQPLWR